MSDTSLVFTLVTSGVEDSVTIYHVDKTKTTNENVKALGQNIIAESGADTIKSVTMQEEKNSVLNITFD